MKTLSVVCPVYNESEIILSFYKELKASLYLIQSDYDSEVIFCLDKSEDNTFELLKKLSSSDSKVKIILMSSRFGHQSALLAGLDHSNSDITIMMDSDLQHPPDKIPEMIKKYEEGANIVYTKKISKYKTPILNRFASSIFYRFLSTISDTKIHLHAADYRLFDKTVTEIFKNNIREKNFFLRGLVSWVGFNQACVEIEVPERFGGQSKYDLSRLVSFALTGIVSFSVKPLRLAIYLGAVTSLMALCYIIFSLGSFFLGSEILPGWTSLAILISFFAGIQMVILGIIGEYIGAIFLEVKGRPHYIVEEKINL